jgi:hypothetical protein
MDMSMRKRGKTCTAFHKPGKACQRAPHEVPRSPGLRPLRTYPRPLEGHQKRPNVHPGRNDFGVRYTNKADAARLMHNLKQQYKVSENLAGTRYRVNNQTGLRPPHS